MDTVLNSVLVLFLGLANCRLSHVKNLIFFFFSIVVQSSLWMFFVSNPRETGVQGVQAGGGSQGSLPAPTSVIFLTLPPVPGCLGCPGDRGVPGLPWLPGLPSAPLPGLPGLPGLGAPAACRPWCPGSREPKSSILKAGSACGSNFDIAI